jgi:hypothetical protein
MEEDPRYEALCLINKQKYMLRVFKNRLILIPFYGGFFSSPDFHPEKADHVFTKDIDDVVLQPGGLFSRARLSILLDDGDAIELALWDKNDAPELQEQILSVLKDH